MHERGAVAATGGAAGGNDNRSSKFGVEGAQRRKIRARVVRVESESKRGIKAGRRVGSTERYDVDRRATGEGRGLIGENNGAAGLLRNATGDGAGHKLAAREKYCSGAGGVGGNAVCAHTDGLCRADHAHQLERKLLRDRCEC